MKSRLMEVAKLKMELEGKVETLENTNFMLDMKVKEKEEEEVQKKEEMTEMTNKVFLLEMKVMEKEELEKTNEEKMKTLNEEKIQIEKTHEDKVKTLNEENTKAKEELIEKTEKEKRALKAEIKNKIMEIQSSSRGRITVNMCVCLDPGQPPIHTRGGDTQGQSGRSQGQPTSWECLSCTFLNPGENQSCAMCNRVDVKSSNQAGGLGRQQRQMEGTYGLQQGRQGQHGLQRGQQGQPGPQGPRRFPGSAYAPNNMAVWEGNGGGLGGGYQYHQEEDDDAGTIEIID